MKTLDFEKLVEQHSLMPKNNLYNAVGLCGECGEVANIIKKMAIRKTLPAQEIVSIRTIAEYEAMLDDELGDVLFYLTRIALDNDISLETLMDMQAKKLQKQNKKYNKQFLK